jgi:glycerol uptake operon antiterminator
MKRNDFIRFLRDNRVVGAVKDLDGLKKIITSNCPIVFVLFGDIVNIPDIVSKIKNAGKIVFVHVDLIDGLASRSVAVDFIAKDTCADGIISTRPNIVKRAKNFNLLTVQRFFVLDSARRDAENHQKTGTGRRKTDHSRRLDRR